MKYSITKSEYKAMAADLRRIASQTSLSKMDKLKLNIIAAMLIERTV